MLKKEKISIVTFTILSITLTVLPWYGKTLQMTGISLLQNPLMLLVGLSVLIGVIKDCNTLSMVGAVILLGLEIFHMIKWTYIVGLPVSSVLPGFYIAVIMSSILVVVNGIYLYKSFSQSKKIK